MHHRIIEKSNKNVKAVLGTCIWSVFYCNKEFPLKTFTRYNIVVYLIDRGGGANRLVHNNIDLGAQNLNYL